MSGTESISRPSAFQSIKITDTHRAKLAVVYVRQSSPQQVVENRESLARQYSLADYARALGWPADRVLVIDEDLGQSGRTADARLGFQRLLAEVTMDHVGMVLGLEMSRLSRSCKDWHHLLEVCGIFGALLADQDGVYDPSDPNDRLVLGLKGQLSEMELHTIRSRLERGKLNKARRGELIINAPSGYVKTASGGLALDPDDQVRTVIRLIFDKFDELGAAHAVTRYLRQHRIRIGIHPP
jgi:DNA invertase Pin-like site-specific DNA recombinase